MSLRIFNKDAHNPGFRVQILGLHIRFFSREKWIRADINIRTPFWLKVFRRNTIYICDHQLGV